jgi:TM2 domain-containing membrane protein YozV
LGIFKNKRECVLLLIVLLCFLCLKWFQGAAETYLSRFVSTLIFILVNLATACLKFIYRCVIVMYMFEVAVRFFSFCHLTEIGVLLTAYDIF